MQFIHTFIHACTWRKGGLQKELLFIQTRSLMRAAL